MLTCHLSMNSCACELNKVRLALPITEVSQAITSHVQLNTLPKRPVKLEFFLHSWWWSWTIGWLSYKTENILGILHHNVCLTLPGRVESYFSYSIMTCYYLLYVPDDFKSDYKNFDKSNVPENKPNLYFKIMQRSVQSCIIPCR